MFSAWISFFSGNDGDLLNRFFIFFSSFIEEKSSFEYGQVNHALTAAMRTLMKEYLILITQLEHLQRQGLLSLQKLWFYIQPTMRTMEILASIGRRLHGTSGRFSKNKLHLCFDIPDF